MVVNDVIVLVALINRLQKKGLPLESALQEGIRRRFRPILMTSVTTIIGLLPMALGLGGYSQVWSPFAATMSFGLLSAFLLIVLVVPRLVKLVAQLTPGSGSGPRRQPQELPLEALDG